MLITAQGEYSALGIARLSIVLPLGTGIACLTALQGIGCITQAGTGTAPGGTHHHRLGVTPKVVMDLIHGQGTGVLCQR